MSTVKFNKWENVDGTENYKCRAWVNFNGTITSGDNRRASGNVSSVTRNGAGDYTVNFATAMPDANYTSSVTSVTLAGTALNTGVPADSFTARTATALRLFFTYIAGGSINLQDPTVASVAIFR